MYFQRKETSEVEPMAKLNFKFKFIFDLTPLSDLQPAHALLKKRTRAEFCHAKFGERSSLFVRREEHSGVLQVALIMEFHLSNLLCKCIKNL